MVPVFLGAGTLFYSLFTEYEAGVRGVIPMRWHLRLELAAGLLLAASPWLFDFARTVWVLHGAFGAFAIVAALVTRTAVKRAPAPPEPFPAGTRPVRITRDR
jgi:hypothetical protein